MASWFIIGLATIVLVGIMMFAGANLVTQSTTLAGQSEDLTRLSRVADILLANAWQDQNGDLHLLMPSFAGAGPAAGTAILPTNLAPLAVSTKGYPFVYCPFGDETASPNASIFMPSGAAYNVTTTTYNGQQYVVAGRPSYADAATNKDLLGFVMAPNNKTGAYGGCDTITGSAGSYSAPNMYVQPIFRSRATAMTLAPGNTIHTFYVTTSGTGNGMTPSSPASLATALASWRQNPYIFTSLQLGAGSYSLGATLLTSSAADYVAHPNGATLSISAANGTTITTSDGLNLPVNVILNNVTFSGPIITTTGNYIAANSSTLEGGSVTINNGANFFGTNMAYSYTGTNAFVLNQDATATFYGSNSFNVSSNYSAFNLNTGATLSFNGNGSGTTNFYGSTSGTTAVLTGAAGSVINVNNTTIQTNSNAPYFVNTYGIINMNTATMNNVAGGTAQVYLNSGAIGNLNNTLLAAYQSNTTNVESNAAAFVTGNGSEMFNGTYFFFFFWGFRLTHAPCWVDNTGNPMFTYSGSGVGSTSQVPANVAVPTLTGTPSAAQISAYDTAVETNVGEASARQRNLSNWSCV